ncbi:MAG: HEPN domain-containing protein [Nitrospirae bacterium]|nr:HEPN domain-containing protein [Nitrospirota bacterium]
MHFKDDAEYRKRLAKGFLEEARLNLKHQLWRSCVDNSQLSIENSGRMLIALFKPVEKSHNPSRQIKRLAEQKKLSDDFKSHIDEIVPILERFGIEEHFMTDYGDETTRTDPWSLFDDEDAKEALEMAERCYSLAEEIYTTYLQ